MLDQGRLRIAIGTRNPFENERAHRRSNRNLSQYALGRTNRRDISPWRNATPAPVQEGDDLDPPDPIPPRAARAQHPECGPGDGRTSTDGFTAMGFGRGAEASVSSTTGSPRRVEVAAQGASSDRPLRGASSASPGWVTSSGSSSTGSRRSVGSSSWARRDLTRREAGARATPEPLRRIPGRPVRGRFPLHQRPLRKMENETRDTGRPGR